MTTVEDLREDLLSHEGEGTTVNSSLKSDTIISLTSDKDKYPSYITKSFHNLKDRTSETFDPFETKTAYSNRTKSSKMFSKLQGYSIRTGSVGYISAIMGTGLMAVPNGMANIGWVGSIFIICFSILCHIYSFNLITHSQSSVSFLFLT